MSFNDERGSSTAELAVLLPAIALMLSLVLATGVVGSAQIRVQQAAAAVARELARGEDQGYARSTGVRLAGEEAHFEISRSPQFGEVIVSREVRLPLLGSITVRGHASVALEDQ